MEGNGGGGEVRRIHVVYLLSRMGRMEQPHLFRVHHLARSGVRLKDVKRWLGELRGKNMPDSFSWSYKRRYKTGFVWQDLMDDDLITPISDNEYVLKGSDIHSATVRTNPCCYREKSRAVKKLDPAPPSPEKELAGGSSEDPPASISGGNNKELAGKGSECSSPSSSSSLSSFSSSSFAAASDCSKEAKPANGTGGGSAPGASPGGGVVRSLLSCGVVDTSDASILRGGRRPAGGATTDGLGGSARFFSNSDWFQSSETRMKWRSFSSLTGLSVKPKKKKEKMEDGDELNKEGSEDPVLTHAIEPLCSQCGKGFRPEKLQAHMKSCKGLKSKAKMGSSAATETPSPFATTVNKRAFSFFL